MRLLVLFLLGLNLVFLNSCKESGPPNIVLIYIDDLGYKDLVSYGNEYFETPHIDKLMNSGLMFNDAYSCAPLCAPSRIAMLSGWHSARAGCYEVTPASWNEVGYFLNVLKMDPNDLIVDWEDKVDFRNAFNTLDLPEGRKILPEYLNEIGYFTGFMGKWHVGPQTPNDRGFDEHVELKNVNSGGSHMDVRKGFVSKTDAYPEPEGLSADYMTEIGLHFIDRAEERPFFLYFSHPLIHTPFEAPEELIDKYRSKTPSAFHSDPVYAAMVELLDESVGNLIEGMKERDLLDNTVIIFTSDNGGLTGAVEAVPELDNYMMGVHASNYPLKGGKVQLWEGGIRVPFGISHGDKIKHAEFSGMISQLDILPTILDLAGHPEYEEIKEEFDGKSLKPILYDNASPWPERSLFWHFPAYRGMSFKPKREGQGAGWDQRPESVIRRGDWKLFESLETGEARLYNLAEDIGETTDVAGNHPALVQELLQELHDWRKDTNAPMPVPK